MLAVWGFQEHKLTLHADLMPVLKQCDASFLPTLNVMVGPYGAIAALLLASALNNQFDVKANKMFISNGKP